MWNQGNSYIAGKSPPPHGLVVFCSIWIEFLYFPTEHLWFPPEGNRKLQFSEGKYHMCRVQGLAGTWVHFLRGTQRFFSAVKATKRPRTSSLLQKSRFLTVCRNSDSLILKGLQQFENEAAPPLFEFRFSLGWGLLMISSKI